MEGAAWRPVALDMKERDGGLLLLGALRTAGLALLLKGAPRTPLLSK
ncbi:hypothetical protein C725_1378 [Pacificimonas flava]|uniref:Uncharacterized protein n=1 Tax=Pacificimonas flava TaxID=1234595 RepID=M2U628_9SPHN|nr:hypothetical protein C725_1378 [Pacificimonas flava]